MGSSELMGEDINYTKPFNFIPLHTDFDVLAIGHAGNQSFSIFAQLLSASQYLQDSKIVFIVSPGWFTDYSSGTSLASFLEFNNDRFLLRVLYNPDGNPRFLDYIGKYISKNYSLIESPSNVIKYYYYRNLSLHSSIHKVAYTPILWSLGILNNFSLYKIEDDLLNQGVKPVLDSVNKKINWDKYFANAKAYHQSISTNNSWGINNDYYSDYLKNKEQKRRIVVNNKGENQEFNDFIKLLDLLDYYETNPIFIIQPLNPYAFDDLYLFKPIIDEITIKINDYKFPVLNQFIYNEDEFEIGILTDAMHMGDLGWYKMNKFIIENYY